MLRGRRENKLLVEPAAVATGDIAFNLIVFFLVCASTQPGSGRKQELPRSEQTKSEQKSNNIEIALTRTSAVVSVNGEPVKLPDLGPRLARLLSGRTKPEDKVIVLKTKPDVPYEQWIAVAALIQDQGGSLTIQREEEQTVVVGS